MYFLQKGLIVNPYLSLGDFYIKGCNKGPIILFFYSAVDTEDT